MNEQAKKFEIGDIRPGNLIQTRSTEHPESFVEEAFAFLVIDVDKKGATLLWFDDMRTQRSTWTDLMKSDDFLIKL
jgi:hypothetical protein